MIGQATASGDSWNLVGSYTSGETIPNFELNGAGLTNVSGAARPYLLLKPAGEQLCTLNKDCRATIDNESAVIQPITLVPSDSALVVQKFTSIAKDTLQEVNYYTNGQLMYTTTTLQPYNLAFADYFEQKIARVLVYQSGQRAVLESTVPDTFYDSPQNALLRQITRHSTLAISLAIGSAIILLIVIAHAVARRYNQISYYNYAHGLGRHTLSPRQVAFKNLINTAYVKYGSLVLATVTFVALTVFSLHTYVLAPYRVNGTSMYATLQDKQTIMINKLPVTLNRYFKPARGQIIVFHPNYGGTLYADNPDADSTFVKRIVGLPGERISMSNGKLVVYNNEHPNGYTLEDTEPWGKKVTLNTADEPFDLTLSQDQIFVAGDNRPHSVDSRVNGPLPLSQVIGVIATK